MKQTSKILICLGIVLTLLGRAGPAYSQTVIASMGSDTIIGNISIGYTIGETVINTLSVDSTYLTEGFQQPAWLSVGIIETDISDPISVYPNPTPGLINVQVGTQNFNAVVYDLLGQVVIKPPNISGLTQIDLGQLAPANYVLVLTNSKRSYTIQLVKIQ